MSESPYSRHNHLGGFSKDCAECSPAPESVAAPVDHDQESGDEAKSPQPSHVVEPKPTPELKAAQESPRDAFRRSVGFQIMFILHSGMEIGTAIDHICNSADKLLAARCEPTQATKTSEASYSPVDAAESSLQHETEFCPDCEAQEKVAWAACNESTRAGSAYLKCEKHRSPESISPGADEVEAIRALPEEEGEQESR